MLPEIPQRRGFGVYGSYRAISASGVGHGFVQGSDMTWQAARVALEDAVRQSFRGGHVDVDQCLANRQGQQGDRYGLQAPGNG
ncbi:MAG: hypothetical protein R3E84_11130 [Pseudomonadales bacterium]